MDNDSESSVGETIRYYRLMKGFTLRKLSIESGVSPSHLGRIERGERFPSAHVLRRIAKPLGFTEKELFTLAKYLSPDVPEKEEKESVVGKLDPDVARILVQETPEIQRAVIGIFSILKIIARSGG